MAEKDQAQATEQSETKIETKVEEEKQPETAQELYDTGFEKYGEDIAGEEEEATPAKKVEKKAEEEECVGCGKSIDELPTEIDQVLWDKVNYASPDYPKPLKVQGKVVWVKDANQMAEMAMKGDAFTQKTQALAEKKKAFEEERVKTVGEVDALAQRTAESIKRLESLSSLIYKDPKVQEAVSEAEKEAGTRELTEAEILQSYGIDPDDLTVEDYSKKIALDNYALKQELKKSGKASLEEKRKTDFIILEKFAGNIVKVAQEARKQYPYEEVMGTDEAGKPQNKTALYFTTEMVKRVKEQEGKPANERKDAGAITIEVVKEIHEMQKGQASSKEGTLDLSGLTLEEINAKIKETRPDLFGEKPGGNDKGKKPEADQSSTEKSEKKSAPSLRTDNREKVNIDQWRKQRGHEDNRFATAEEGIEAAFGPDGIDFDAED